MFRVASRSNVGDTANRLRTIVLARREGDFLGNEEVLERELSASKPTIRQAARMLEREGLLRVKRGNAGGYFAARPDAAFIEATVASYLEALHAKPQDLTRVASALWVETVRQAAGIGGSQTAALVKKFRRVIGRIADDASFGDIQRIEQELRTAVFDLVGSPYVELIFNINANFARRKFKESPAKSDDTAQHRAFVAEWRKAANMLIAALDDSDSEIAAISAQRGRQLFHKRIWPDNP